MVHPKQLVDLLRAHGYGPYISIPCPILKSLINYIVEEPSLSHYSATDEGEALAMASGMRLTGKKPVVMIQNSGLGNMINPLTSLNLVFNIPVLLIISWRGEPGKPDEPQHRVMGALMIKFLEVMGIEYELLDEKPLEQKIQRLTDRMNKTYKPAALIVPGGALETYSLKKNTSADARITMKRRDGINIIVQNLTGNELLVASTGKISRELYFMKKPVKAPFYVLGSMGCTGSLAFGIAQADHKKKVIILDGDGAVLMKMGTLATIGQYHPANIIHFVLDNESYEFTGGQHTVSSTVSFDKVAGSCGYKNTACIYEPEELSQTVQEILRKKGPSFIQVKVLQGSDPNLGRPKDTPNMLKDKFLNNFK